MRTLPFKVQLLHLFAMIMQIQSICNTEDIYLFSPSPVIQIPHNQICTKDSKIEKILLLQNLKSSQILGWGSKCGWNLIDYEDSSSISIQKINTKIDFPQSMAIQENILWIAHEKTLTAYMLTKGSKLEIFKSVNKQQTEYSTSNIYFSEDKKFLFLQSLFKVESYSISDLNNIKYLHTIQRVQNILSMNISTQLNYIVIGLKEGLALYSWQYDTNLQTYVAFEQCYKFELISVLKIEFLNVTTLILQTFVTGLVIGDLKGFLDGASCSSIKLMQVQGLHNFILNMNYMLVSRNQRYVISEQRVQSISIFEVNLQGDYQFPILQQIDVPEKTYDLQISLDEQSIISSSFTNINIYKRSIPNYKNIVPNIQNGQQNYVFQDFPINTNSGRRCVLKDNLLYYAKMLDGIYILQVDPYTNYLKILSRLKENFGSYELVMPMDDPTKLIVGNNKLLFYDISDLTKPLFKLSTDFKLPNIDGDYIVISKDQKTGYISGGYEGLIIIDLSDFNKPVLISSINHNFKSVQITSAENVQINSREEYAFVCYRFFGVIVYDVRDKVHPKIASYIQTNGAEDLKLTSDDKYMIISDIHRGITIVNIEDPTNIFEISNIYVEGETLRTNFIFDEQYLLSVSVQRGNLQLIDIRDKANPKILQKYQYQKNSQANDVCVTKDNNIAYLTLNQQIIMMNIFSKSTQFNVDFMLVQSGISTEKKILDMNDILLLGQKVEIKLVQIYPKNRVYVTDVKFYDNYVQYNLPSWVIFQVIEQKLTIHITNDALDKQNPNSVVMKSFLFQIKEPLLTTDFIRPELNIDQTKSNQIYQNCLKNKLVDFENLVIESQQENILGIFGSYSESEQNHILKIIKSKIFYYPVYINVKGSLQIAAQIDEKGFITQSNENVEIKSISDTVKVQVVVYPDQGQFQKYMYPGVLVYFNENQNTMKLEGDITAVNNILKQGGFKFANYTYHDDIILSMTIDDTINYPVTLKFKASNSNLIQLNNIVLNNENNSIQSDFSSKFQDSSVSILSSFSYTISTKIFIDKDNDQLIYTAKVQIDGEFQQIPESFWLNFQSSDRTFYGTTIASQYGETVKLKVIASDGYTEASDILVISISRVPVTYILQIVAQIAGPILGLLGMWKYKALLWNIIMKKQYSGSKLYFFPETQFQIQIPLLEDQLLLAQNIWKEFYSQIDKKAILIEINQLKLRYKLCQNNLITNSFLMKNETSYKQESSPIEKTDSYPFNLTNPDAQIYFANQNSPSQHSQFTECCQTIYPINDTPKLPTKTYKERHSKIKQTQYSYIKQTKNSFIEKHKQQKKMGFFSLQTTNETQYLNLEYFKPNGELNKQMIIKKVQNYYLNHFKKANKFIIDQLEIPTSRLSQSIISLCAIEIAILEKTPITLLNFLRDTAIQEGFSSNSWYKAYVQIVPQFNQVFIDPFPKLILNENKILKQINIIKCNLPDESDTDIYLYLPLVIENIKSITYGLTFNKSQFFTKIRGESLELSTHDILCIKTYRPIKKRSFSLLTCKRKDKEVYIEKELSQNSMVPSWITSVDISNGVILISGRLYQKDVGQYILKIFDTKQFIIKQIEIVIKDKIPNIQNQTEMVSQQRQTIQFYNQNSPRNIGEMHTEEIPQEKNNIEFRIYSYKQTQKNSEYTSANALFEKYSD